MEKRCNESYLLQACSIDNCRSRCKAPWVDRVGPLTDRHSWPWQCGSQLISGWGPVTVEYEFYSDYFIIGSN